MRPTTLLRILTVSLTPVALAISGCNSPVSLPSNPTIDRPLSTLHASGAIYGTPFSFDNSEYSNVGYGYVDTVWSGILFDINYTVVNQDQLSFSSQSVTGGYNLRGLVGTNGKGSMTTGQYFSPITQISISQDSDAAWEQGTRTIDKEVVTIVNDTPYSKIAGSFELRWHYKFDTTRVGYVTGSFSIGE